MLIVTDVMYPLAKEKNLFKAQDLEQLTGIVSENSGL